MKRNIHAPKIAVSLVAALTLTASVGCTNSDYDLSDIDTTIGIGGDSLSIPTSSTEDIVLDDVLELNNSDLITTEANGDYVFVKNGDAASPARPHIGRLTVAKQQLSNQKVVVDLSAVRSAAARGKSGSSVRRTQIAPVTISGVMTTFKYQTNDVDKAIKGLSSVGLSAPMDIRVDFSQALRQAVPTIKTMKITFPSYMFITAGGSEATNTITFSNVNTARGLIFGATLRRMDFGKATTGTDRLTFTPGEGSSKGSVRMEGSVKMEVTFDEVNATTAAAADCYIDAKTSLDDIDVNSATGKFDPEISLNNLGKVTINNVPDFLTDDEANINLHNPQINLSVANDMDVEGKVSGVLKSYDSKGALMASVNVPEMTLHANATTDIVICKTAEGLDATGRDLVVVPSLSDIIAKIPHRIEFEANARANSSRECTVQLGHDYAITPTYSVKAPLAFDEGAQIVYRDTLDGWHDDIEDLSLTEGAYLQVKANVDNRIPANLSVSAYAIGTDGKALGDDKIQIEVKGSVKGAADSQQAVTSPLQVRLYEKAKGAIKSLDGIVFKVEAGAGEGSSAIVGKTINAKTQTLTIRDIRIQLFGKVIGDFN